MHSFLNHYSSEIASTGQAPVQARHEIQLSVLHSAFPSPLKSKAPTGQVPTHAPHPMQVS